MPSPAFSPVEKLERPEAATPLVAAALMVVVVDIGVEERAVPDEAVEELLVVDSLVVGDGSVPVVVAGVLESAPVAETTVSDGVGV